MKNISLKSRGIQIKCASLTCFPLSDEAVVAIFELRELVEQNSAVQRVRVFEVKYGGHQKNSQN